MHKSKRVRHKASTFSPPETTIDALAIVALHMRLNLIVLLSQPPNDKYFRMRPSMEVWHLGNVSRELYNCIRASPRYSEDQLAISFAWVCWTTQHQSTYSDLAPYPNGLAQYLRSKVNMGEKISSVETSNNLELNTNIYELAAKHAKTSDGIARIYNWVRDVQRITSRWSHRCKSADCNNPIPTCQKRESAGSAACLLCLVCEDSLCTEWVNTMYPARCQNRCTCYCSEGCRHAAAAVLPEQWKLRSNTLHSARLLNYLESAPTKIIPMDISIWLKNALNKNCKFYAYESSPLSHNFRATRHKLYSRTMLDQLLNLLIYTRNVEVALLYAYTLRPRTTQEQMLGVGAYVDRATLLAFMHETARQLHILMSSNSLHDANAPLSKRLLVSLNTGGPCWFVKFQKYLFNGRYPTDPLAESRLRLSYSSNRRNVSPLTTPRLSPKSSSSSHIPPLVLATPIEYVYRNESANENRYKGSPSHSTGKLCSSRKICLV